MKTTEKKTTKQKALEEGSEKNSETVNSHSCYSKISEMLFVFIAAISIIK